MHGIAIIAALDYCAFAFKDCVIAVLPDGSQYWSCFSMIAFAQSCTSNIGLELQYWSTHSNIGLTRLRERNNPIMQSRNSPRNNPILQGSNNLTRFTNIPIIQSAIWQLDRLHFAITDLPGQLLASFTIIPIIQSVPAPFSVH